MKLEKYELGELCEIFGRIGFRGYTVNDLVPKGEGAITFSPSDINNFILSMDNCTYISNFKYEESPEIKVYNGDILFTKTGSSIGKTAYVEGLNEKATINPQFVVLKNFQCNGRYLFYVLSSKWFQKNIWNIVVGSTVPTMSQEDFKKREIFLPAKMEQDKIAKILTDIDSKIAVNKKINKELEVMAKELYDYWFVQFDFPGVDGKPYKSSGGKMVYNEVLKRDIPDGWEVKKIQSLIKENIGGDWGKEEPEGNYQLKVSCCRGADIVSMTDLPTRYILNANSSKLLEEEDMVVEISGGSPIQATGRCVLISKEILNSFDNKLICSNFCQALSISEKDYVSYFYHMWKMFYDSDIFFNFEGKTSGIKNFQYDTFVAEKWYFPPKELAKKFDEIISQNYKKKCALDQENKHLVVLRDELLPMLMNGQVSIK